jgi:hypothetical protein
MAPDQGGSAECRKPPLAQRRPLGVAIPRRGLTRERSQGSSSKCYLGESWSDRIAATASVGFDQGGLRN